jgi:hypothetical protein
MIFLHCVSGECEAAVGNRPACPCRSVEAGRAGGGMVRLAVVFFYPNIAIRNVKRAIEAMKLACIDDAICTEILFN